jgi:hypothetical protein
MPSAAFWAATTAKSRGGEGGEVIQRWQNDAKKASNKATNKSTVAGKRDVDGCGERCCAWEGDVCTYNQGCPHDFDSNKVKEGNDDSDDEDDTGSDEEEEKNNLNALVCCDMLFR